MKNNLIIKKRSNTVDFIKCRDSLSVHILICDALSIMGFYAQTATIHVDKVSKTLHLFLLRYLISRSILFLEALPFGCRLAVFFNASIISLVVAFPSCIASQT